MMKPIGDVARAIGIDPAALEPYGHYKAKVVSNKPIKLHGYSGRLVTYKGVSNGAKVQLQRLVLAKGHVFYELDAWGNLDDAAADRALFKRFYKTWRPT